MRTCDAMPVEELFDVERIRRRIARGITPPPSHAEVAEVIPKYICGAFDQPDARYVRTTDRVTGGVVRPCFRVDNANRGLTYHELDLALGADGKPRIVDLYLYDRGVWLTELVVESVRIGLDGLAQLGAVLEGPVEQVGQRIEALPPELRASALARLLPLTAAGVRGNADEIRRAAAEVRATYPDDVSADLMALELGTQLRDPGLKLDAVEHLQRRLGDDGWLLTLQSMALAERSDMLEAHRLAEQAAAAAPHLIETARHLVWRKIAVRDYAAAVRALERARRHQPGFDVNWYAGPSNWAELLESPEYVAWKAAAP